MAADEPTTDEQLSAVFAEALRLAQYKERSYRGAWRAQGYMGNLARVLSKAQRLKGIAWRDHSDAVSPDKSAESIEQELIDIINIAAFGLVNLRAGNRWGNEREAA